MALWVCGGESGCGTKYAVGLFRCPRCHNTEFFEDGDPMAKISRAGGASDKTLPVPEESAAAAEPVSTPAAAADQPEPEAEAEVLDVRGEHGPELVDMPVGAVVFPTAADEEGSEESSPLPKTTSKQTATPRRKQARSANPSKAEGPS